MREVRKEKKVLTFVICAYNEERNLHRLFENLVNQENQNFNIIFVNDGSTDNTLQIAKEYMIKNENCIVISKKNTGLSDSRNMGTKYVKTPYFMYLDADDLWKKNKIQNQIDFMLAHDYAFVCSNYEKIDINNKILKQVKIPKEINYKLFLRNTIIQTVGVMIDSRKTGRELLMMPNVRRRQDAATWCQLLKSGFNCYGVPEFLSYYRVVPNSLSSNKIKAIKGTWFLYRKIEKLSLVNACFCFLGYAINAIKKRIYIKIGGH